MFTKEEIEVLSDTSLTNKECAEKLGRLVPCVWKKRNKLNIPYISHNEKVQEQYYKILSLLGKVPDIAISETLGVSITTIRNLRKQYNIQSYRKNKQFRNEILKNAVEELFKKSDGKL